MYGEFQSKISISLEAIEFLIQVRIENSIFVIERTYFNCISMERASRIVYPGRVSDIDLN